MDFNDYYNLVALTATDHVVFSKELNKKIEDDENYPWEKKYKYKYRYEFTRTWEQDNKLLCFIMFNPSTTDNVVLDPTTNECSSIAYCWGYGGIALYNLYAFRSSKSENVEKKLKTKEEHDIAEMVGPRNEKVLDQATESNRYAKIVCAWGNHPHTEDFINRSFNTLERIGKDRLLVLVVTSQGQPMHPLTNQHRKKSLPPITEKDAEDLSQLLMEKLKRKVKAS